MTKSHNLPPTAELQQLAERVNRRLAIIGARVSFSLVEIVTPDGPVQRANVVYKCGPSSASRMLEGVPTIEMADEVVLAALNWAAEARFRHRWTEDVDEADARPW